MNFKWTLDQKVEKQCKYRVAYEPWVDPGSESKKTMKDILGTVEEI